MIALSIRQPWAWLILRPDLTGEARAAWLPSQARKDIENRTWPTKFRGRILVHAGKGCTYAEWDDADCFSTTIGGPSIPEIAALDRGGIVGSVVLFDCVQASESPWFTGDYGFVLRDPQVLPFRPFKGALQFFDVPDATPATGTALERAA